METNRQTIDNYRLTSMEEPTDEVLSQLMDEAAMTASKRAEDAHRHYFDRLQRDADALRRQWFEANPEMLAFAQ